MNVHKVDTSILRFSYKGSLIFTKFNIVSCIHYVLPITYINNIITIDTMEINYQKRYWHNDCLFLMSFFMSSIIIEYEFYRTSIFI